MRYKRLSRREFVRLGTGAIGLAAAKGRAASRPEPRPASGHTRATLALKALGPDTAYEIANLDTGETRTLPGSQLSSEGWELMLLKKPDSALLRYRAGGS